jgi:hypothetical protein
MFRVATDSRQWDAVARAAAASRCWKLPVESALVKSGGKPPHSESNHDAAASRERGFNFRRT